jgi:NIMA (never in mitosis gene a)-related kinase
VKEIEADDVNMITDQMNEARMLISFSWHPHIVKCSDCFISPDSSKLCIVQEYCDKGDLKQLIESQRSGGGAGMREQKIWKFVIEILMALDCIHEQSVVHRDLKPSNIFLKGKNYDVKVGDFGVRKIFYNHQHDNCR